MRQLKTEFIGKGQVKGFKFTQVEKSLNAYLYKVESDGLEHYEVFYHKENDRFNCVSYPSNQAFGIWAWTYKNLETAQNKFEDLCITNDAPPSDF